MYWIHTLSGNYIYIIQKLELGSLVGTSRDPNHDAQVESQTHNFYLQGEKHGGEICCLYR
jgi:hypothetical protein